MGVIAINLKPSGDPPGDSALVNAFPRPNGAFMYWQSFCAIAESARDARATAQTTHCGGSSHMNTDLNFANDEWFWKAWSETISKRYAKALHGHYSKHADSTIVNDRSLLSSEFLEQYAALVMLLERFPSAPGALAGELSNWRPRSYEDYFRGAGLRDGQFAVAAFASTPATVRRPFLSAVAQLDEDSLGAVEAVIKVARQGRPDLLPSLCRERAQRLRARIDEVAQLIADAPRAENRRRGQALAAR